MRTKQGSYPADAPAQAARLKEDAPKSAGRPSSLVDTRVIYCGDCLDQLRKLPDACVDLIYIDPPFNSNRNYEVFWGETKEKRAFADRHESTRAYIDYMRPRCVEMENKTGGFSRAHKRSCKERSSCRFGALDGTTGANVSGGGNVDENHRFENPLSLTVKKQTTDSGSCRLVLRLVRRSVESWIRSGFGPSSESCSLR